MSLEEMAAVAAAAITVLGSGKGVGYPEMALQDTGVVTLTYPDGQVFEVRVTMLKGIDKQVAAAKEAEG